MELFTTGAIIRGAKKQGFFFFVLSNFFLHRSTKKRAVQSDLSLDHVPGAAAVAQKGRSGHNQKLFQAFDDGLRWVLSKNIINHIFKCGSMLLYFYLYFKMFSCKGL